MKNTYISSLNLSSFAGRTRSHGFTPGVNLVIGANGAGKTTISNAISFVLAGKVPGLPKTNGGIMDAIGSGLRMGAALDIGGKTYDRSLTRSGKTVKGEAKSPAPADLLPPVMLDLEPFLAASPKARASMILGACGDDVPTKLRNLLSETGLEKLTGTIKAFDDVQEWLISVEDIAKATASGYTASIKDMRGTLAGMEVLDTSAPAPSGPPISELRANVSRLEREIATLTGEANAIASRPAPVQPPGERPNGTAEAFETQLAEVQAKLRVAQADLAQAQTDRQAWDRWQAESRRLEAKLAEAQAAYQVVADGWEAVEDIDNKLLSAQQALGASISKWREATNSVLVGLEVCSCCGAAKKDWAVTPPDDIQILEKQVDANEAKVKSFLQQQKAAAAVARASEAVLRANQATLDHAKQGQNWVQMDSDLYYAGIVDDLTETADALTAEARRARAWDGYDISANVAETSATRAVQIAEHVTELTKQHATARSALIAAEINQEAQAQAEARQAMRKQAEERLAGLEKDEQAFKAARLVWDAGVKAIMDHALRGVLDVCQTFTKGLFSSPLTVHELALGVYQDATWIPMDAFSGSDKRIAVAALQAALAIRHQGFRLIILDEFGVIDPGRKPAVLANLAAAVEAGLVDQVFVMDNRHIDGVPEGINQIQLV